MTLWMGIFVPIVIMIFCNIVSADISLEYSRPGKEKYIEIFVYDCVETELLGGQYCADKEEIKEFKKNTSFNVIFFLEEYNYRTK